MKTTHPLFLGALLIAVVCCLVQPALSAEPGTLPAPVDRKVDFHKDIFSILANSCAKCHAGGKAEGGFSLDTREALLKGGESGPAVVPGNSAASRLIAMVGGLDPDAVMPAQGPRLTASQVALLRAWIDQDLPWEPGFSFKRTPAAPLAPRIVTVPNPPPGQALPNPIDRILVSYFAEHGVQPAAPVDDRTFLRRAALDIIGLPPSAAELDAFAADISSDKRERISSQLLNDKPQYAMHWLTFWNDALRNDYRGTGYIDGGRLQITDWLAQALVENRPYDQFVRELIDPSPEAAGFIKGIVWRGVVNASQVPPVQAAQNLAQVFLGINLKCASCHDSFVSEWKLTEAYALASVFSDAPLEIHRCDQPTGQFATPAFLYPQLGSIDAQAPREQRLKQLAAVFTKPENGRLARTIVNRLWARLLGRGLVEPVDEMDNPPWNADLLDYLAVDLVEHGYDLKHTILQIVTSRAYQLPSVALRETERDSYVFRGPAVKRLSAEQFVDAVSILSGVEYAPAAVKPAAIVATDAQASPAGAHGLPGARAALVHADPLLTALGRSNREQVVTQRPSAATTLQALELTNGTPLATLLEKGAKQWSATTAAPDALIDQIYLRSLARPPSPAERSLANELLEGKVTQAGIEDLLWAIVVLPEFQLIY